jgi:hypothetical protein
MAAEVHEVRRPVDRAVATALDFCTYTLPLLGVEDNNRRNRPETSYVYFCFAIYEMFQYAKGW